MRKSFNAEARELKKLTSAGEGTRLGAERRGLTGSSPGLISVNPLES